MILEKKSIKLLQTALEKLDQGFNLPPLDDTVDFKCYGASDVAIGRKNAG